MTDPFDYGEAQQSDGPTGSFLAVAPVVLRERKWWIVVPALLGLLAAGAAVALIPPEYRANAVMLVQSPQLPNEVLALDGPEVVDRRIARIEEQVTARPDLIAMIERHGLYSAERKTESLSELVERMRDGIDLVANEAGDSRSQDNTIAFELSFEYSEPVAAQAVAQDLMERILALDTSGNVAQATNTAEFLQDQSSELEKQISEVQGQIARITALNGSSLGGAGGVITSNSGSYDVQIAGLQRENQQLQAQKNLALSSNERDPVVISAESQLAAARAVYAENHPDVVIAKQKLAEAKELAKANSSRLPVDSIDDQIAFNKAQIRSLTQAKARDDAFVQGRLAAQARAPLVEQQIGDLQQTLSTLNQQYQQVQNRLMNAKAGLKAEDEQMGERLVVVEPPVIPDEPVWPDKLLIILIGIAGGLALGLALAFGTELIFQPIRQPESLGAAIGASPLGVIPLIEIRHDRISRRRTWRLTSVLKSNR